MCVSFLGAAVMSQRCALNVGKDGTLQVADSVGFILPHPLDLHLLQPQLLQHGGHLALFVQEHLSVVTAQYCRTASQNREEGMKDSTTENISHKYDAFEIYNI